jgi:hypothetical protein
VIIIEVMATVGWTMSPTEIVKGCQVRSKKLFHSLHADVVRKWIDRTGPCPCWSDETLAKVAKGNCPGGKITERGILVSYRKNDNKYGKLKELGSAGIPSRHCCSDQADIVEHPTSWRCIGCSPNPWRYRCTDSTYPAKHPKHSREEGW